MDAVEALVRKTVGADEPGLALALVQDGRVLFRAGRGVADIRSGRPIDTGTNFRLASLTKQFTATAIMLLVREGKLDYETHLTDIFPDFPEYGKEITIRHLLTHTSGLPDYENLMPEAKPNLPVEDQQINDYQVLELLKGEKQGKFRPGTNWDYSNSGYVVLGLIVEKVSGMAFGIFLSEKIFKPLGMKATVLYEKGISEVENRAFGHVPKDGNWIVRDQSLTSATRGDGCIYSSVDDLILWDKAWKEGTLLSREEMALALTPVEVPQKGPVDPYSQPAAYGFGWFLNPWKGYQRAWHYGETAGFRTAIHRFLETGLTVIVLCNREDIEASGLALRLGDIFLAGKAPGKGRRY
ncbi:MAG: beta-lactamase family protein [Candidatus Aminicenantes bacterium]|uniref:Beta-lactamase n=1 Tax=Candidatus Saccharicenans subterraneus TaxID=2508984 RepID=A0A3E2BKL2_9BACT|nr:beta-lactamase family protein [Candidatus Aminicenantes bacterium]RFT15285.1 MAG: Beta-lactamase [Candidatus Saccharicenans subterraneum]